MSTQLYTYDITDSYSSRTGEIDYERSDGNMVPTLKHYDIRSFYSSPTQIARTQLDMEFWNAAHFDGMTQTEIENFNAPQGGENWPTGDADVTFSYNSSYRYMPQMAVALTGGVTKTVTSLRFDNLLNNFQDDTYFIELLLPSWPGSPPMDLSQSFIDFSSDPTFATQTDSIPFSASLNSLTGSGDKVFRIARSSLVNVNLGSIAGIRLRLRSSTNQTVRLANMRMLSATYPYEEIQVDTNLGVLRRSAPQAIVPEPSTSFGTMLFRKVTPKNATMSIRFNAGTLPVGNDNKLVLFFRYQDDDNYIKVELTSRSTQSRIIITQRLEGVDTNIVSTPVTSNILTANKNYYLKASLIDTNISAGVYNGVGGFATTPVFETGTHAIEEISRGYLGYEFVPYHYDFTIDYFGNTDVEFATFESTPFETIAPVQGATLIANDSPPIILNKDIDPAASGDATLIHELSLSGRAGVEKLVRSGGGFSWYGGWQFVTPLFLGDTDHVTISGAIYPIDVVRGNYRFALIDSYGSVLSLRPLPVTRANQWNTFNVRVGGAIPPNTYYLYVHQTGFYDDVFYTDDITITHESVAWYAQPDYGLTWQPFLQAIDSPHTGLKFIQNGNAIKIRAVAISDKAWIQGYQLRPLYDSDYDRSKDIFASPYTERASTVKVTATGDTTFDGRVSFVTGQAVASNNTDVRLTGLPGSSDSRSVRVTAVGTNSTSTRGVRIEGTLFGPP